MVNYLPVLGCFEYSVTVPIHLISPSGSSSAQCPPSQKSQAFTALKT
jgi:hypothetical protein